MMSTYTNVLFILVKRKLNFSVPRSDPQNCPLTAMVSEERGVPKGLYTAKKQYRKFETNIPRKGIARPQSRSPHSCVFEYSAAVDLWTDHVNN
jgi:hypothetical protein